MLGSPERPVLGRNNGFLTFLDRGLRGWRQTSKRDKRGQLCQKGLGAVWLQGLGRESCPLISVPLASCVVLLHRMYSTHAYEN